jgi:Tannase-like family of unknown function (DUF6351)
MSKGSRRVALVAGLALACLSAQPVAATAQPEIEVLSNRADLISAGDALVEVKLPDGADPSGLTVTAGERDVTGAFALRENGRFMGLVTDLAVGENVLRAQLPDGSGARITIANHPNGGPDFSGPHVQPWVCQATAVDEHCNQPPTYTYQYMSTSGGFQPYDPENPPSDVATTTTDQGETVPFIVRTETGYQDRDQYRIAVLFDPTREWKPWAPQPGWNHKLLITHGASCGIERHAGEAPDVMNETALSRGFAVMSTALNNAGHNCNIVTQAESMVMAKERLVEQYGEIRYTIGTGCSGGSLTQQQVANAYPGIYQGILPACSFPDAWSTGQQLVDYHLIRAYLEDPSKWAPGVVWTPLQIAQVEGHPNHVNSIVFDTVYWTDLGVPDDGCDSVPSEDTYDAETNPDGVRCTLADYMINVFGPRPQSDWGPQEQALGHGFAGLPLDNVGVQYGLDSLQKGLITTEMFVDLNAKIGGETIDVVPTAERFPATQPALANAYRSGAVNTTNNLDQLAIIDLRGPDPGAFHDAYRSWAIRSRLEREHGTFANQVIWFGQVPLMGDPNYESEAIVAMDRWLASVEADGSDKPLSQKILDNRPADIQDRCSQVDGVEQVSVPGIGTVCEHEQLQTRYGTPRTVAGEPISTDQNKCTLAPLRRSDYYPIEFTDEQWARLETAFPSGVCDWSEPGVSQQGAIPWQTYQDASGAVIYGGRPLGEAPRSEAFAGSSSPDPGDQGSPGGGPPSSTPGIGPPAHAGSPVQAGPPSEPKAKQRKKKKKRRARR